MSLCRRFAEWRSKRRLKRRYGKIEQVTVLTKPVVCFGRELEFSLPPGFRLNGSSGSALFFESAFLHLTVQRCSFRRHLHTLTSRELAVYFRRALPVLSFPEFRRSYLRHSPMLTAFWDTRQTADLRVSRAALVMIQVQQTVYILLMTGNDAVISSYPAVIAASVQVHPERVAQRMQSGKALPQDRKSD